MALKQRGRRWYLKKTLTVDGRRIRREFPLGLHRDKERAAKAAAKLAKQLDWAASRSNAKPMVNCGLDSRTWRAFKRHWRRRRGEPTSTG